MGQPPIQDITIFEVRCYNMSSLGKREREQHHGYQSLEIVGENNRTKESD